MAPPHLNYVRLGFFWSMTPETNFEELEEEINGHNLLSGYFKIIIGRSTIHRRLPPNSILGLWRLPTATVSVIRSNRDIFIKIQKQMLQNYKKDKPPISPPIIYSLLITSSYCQLFSNGSPYIHYFSINSSLLK